MRPELFTIRRTGPGALSTMARPLGGEWLGQAMEQLAAAGVGVLASLLTDTEMAELGLTGEADAARAAGITFYRLPTPDRHVPDPAASLQMAGTLRGHLNQGDGVAVHCRFGIGRSSTLAAMVLVLEGTPPREAWAMISEARGITVPDTAAQLEAVLRMQPRSPAGEPPGGDTLTLWLLQDGPDTAHSR